MSEGVSIVVCCHNSARLLPKTLSHLSAQELPTPVACEVIVVDNASTDATSEVARECWPVNCSITLRIVPEPRLGLSNARLRGIAESKYPLICFVDDDNRLGAGWVALASKVMSEHPEVGACGGQIEAEFETVPPPWFDQFREYYPLGEQAERAGDVSDTRGYLWGAGLCLRKEAVENLFESGFNFLLSDRKGTALSSGGDAELCYALRLTGWRLWYEPGLVMSHFLPAARLRWQYLRQVCRGFGAATAGIDSYEIAVRGDPLTIVERLRRTWIWQTLATLRRLLGKPIKLLRASVRSMEGDGDVLQIENLWGRVVELLHHRRSYVSSLKSIRRLQKDQVANALTLQEGEHAELRPHENRIRPRQEWR